MHASEQKYIQLIKKFETGRFGECADQCAKKIVANPTDKETRFFYRLWLESLHEDHDVYALQQLSLHLMKRRNESKDYLALALVGLAWAGRMNYAKVVYRNLYKSSVSAKRQSWTMLEALALVSLENSTVSARKKAMKTLSHVAQTKRSYLSARHLLKASLQNLWPEMIDEANELMNRIHPKNIETLEVNASLHCSLGEWQKASMCLRDLLVLDKTNLDGILMLSVCYEKMGDLIAAKNILMQNRHLFDTQEYEWNINLGMIHKKLFERYQSFEDFNLSLTNLDKAYAAANSLGISTAAITFEREELAKSAKNDDIESDHTAWIVSIEEIENKKLSSQKTMLLNCVKETKQGNILFLGKVQGNKFFVHGFTKTTSDAFYDPVSGYLSKIEPVSLMPAPIALKASKSYDMVEEWQSNRPHVKSSSVRWFNPSKEFVTLILEHLENETHQPEENVE